MIGKIKEFFIRGKKGWAPSDVWNLDCYLSKVIYESLVYLKKTQHGYPITIPMSDPNNEEELTRNRWHWADIMDKMIYAFKLIKDIGDGKRELYYPKADKNLRQTLEMLTRKEDREMKRGMKLFIKHYFNLWD